MKVAPIAWCALLLAAPVDHGRAQPAPPTPPGARPDAPAAAPAPPRITAPTRVCRPGRTVRLAGRRLGERIGRIRITGLDRPFRGRITRWSATEVTVKLPDIDGVGDGALRLRVWSADGRRSNAVQCTFTAARATVPVKLSQFTVADCATPAGPKHDRNTSTSGLAGCAHDGPGTQGIDRWATPPLAPGWTVSRWHFEDRSGDGGVVEVKGAPAKESQRIAPTFAWSAGGGMASYLFAIRLEGPKGTAPFAEPAR